MTWQEKPSFRQERRRRVRELRQRGATTKQIARTFAHDHDESLLKAFRWAHDWTLAEACERFNNDVADDPEHEAMSSRRLSLYENWPRSANPECRPPGIPLLHEFAKLYQCAAGDLIEATDYSTDTEQHVKGSSPGNLVASDALPAQDAAVAERVAARSPTLLRVLVKQRHWQTYETFVIQYERAAKELAERDQDPRLRGLSINQRQFDRWLAGTVKTMPYPRHCRVLEYVFGRSVDELFSPTSQASEQRRATGLAAFVGAAPAALMAPVAGGASGVADTMVGGWPAHDAALGEAVVAARKQAGRELARLRHAGGLNQQQLANRIGYSRGQVAGAEAGTNSTAVEFWRACDQVLSAGGALVAAREQVEAALKARRYAAARRDGAKRETRLQQWHAQHGLADAMIPRSLTSEPEASDQLLQQWGDLGLLGQVGQRLLTKILEPERSLTVDRRMMLKLLSTSSAVALLETLPADSIVNARPLDLEPTTINVLESLALRYQAMYHSTPPLELMIPVTAHVEIVNDLAKDAATGDLRRRLLRNHSQVALLAGRLSFFDLRDPMAARGYYSMALDSSREANDPHLSTAALGHMSFVSAAGGSFNAALDLLQGADKYASKITILPSWLATIEAEIRAKAGETRASLDAIDRAEDTLAQPCEVPAWMDYYDTTRLNGFKGFAYLAAGKPEEARVALSGALSALDLEAVKQRTVFLADLATTFVHEEEIDKACELAGKAAAALASARYATSLERLHEFRAQVQPWQDRSSVKELDERLALI